MSTNKTTISIRSAESLIVAYYSLTLIIVGSLLNFLTFLILCRPAFRDINARPILHYMRTIAIFDILMLYGWNFDHYLTIAHDFRILRYSIASCKFICFISYFTSQISAWLRVFVCLDRYLLLSCLHKTCFNRSKSILIIIACVIIGSSLLNLHLLIFACYQTKSGTISAQAQSYRIYPLWDYLNLGVYNGVPFILMVILNSGVIYRLIHLHRTTKIQNSRIQYRSISITLVITTFLFLIMTTPSTIAFAFFPNSDVTVLNLLDGILYTYHITSFPLYFITFTEFRQECIGMLTCKNYHQKIRSQIPIRRRA